jgi:hypothetical protein
MESRHTRFRCVLERATAHRRERRVVEVWAAWPGTARQLAARERGGWTVLSVEPDFSRREGPPRLEGAREGFEAANPMGRDEPQGASSTTAP